MNTLKSRFPLKKDSETIAEHFAVGLKLLAAISVTWQSIPVSAQDQQSALEEVMVTARKRTESLQDTPISITAFTNSDIEARQLENISQIDQSTPNLVFDNYAALSGNSASSAIFLRGVGQLDFTLNTDPGVGLYVDDVYISRSIGGLVNLLDIERVEVLRGPQGTLFGRNSIGGAINITTTKPTEEIEGRIGIKAGRFDRWEAYGTLNLPLSESVRSRTSLSVRKRDGYVERLQDNADIGDVDAFSGRSIINWRIRDDLQLDIALDGTRERQGQAPLVALSLDGTGLPFGFLYNTVIAGPFGCAPAPGPEDNPSCFNEQWLAGPFATHGTVESQSNLDLWGISGKLEWDVTDALTLKAITAYRSVSSESSLDLDFSPLTVFNIPDTFQDVDAFSQELQLLGDSLNDKLEWIVGLYYFYEDGDHFEPVISAALDLTSGGATTTESMAAFAQGTYHFTDRLSATVGARWTDDTREFIPNSNITRSIQLPPPFTLPPPMVLVPAVVNTLEAEEFTPLASISYAWSENFNTYLTYSEGFKSGGFSQRINVPLDAAPSYDPEFVEVIEGGFKFIGWNNQLRVNAAVFHSDYTEIQTLGFIPGVIGPATTNAGEAEIRGFELELTLLPTSRFLVQAGIGYMDAEYTQLDPGVIGITLDSRLANTPEWTTNLSASFEIPLDSGSSLTPRIDGFYRSKVFNEGTNAKELLQSGYTLLNASLAFESADSLWRAVVGVKNLTDETYLITGQITDGIGARYGIHGIPRNWFVDLERRF